MAKNTKLSKRCFSTLKHCHGACRCDPVKKGVKTGKVSPPDSVCSPAPAACVRSHSGQTPSCHWVVPAATAGHGGRPQTPPQAGLCPPGSVTPWCEHVTWHRCATPWRVTRPELDQVCSQNQMNFPALLLLLVLFSKMRHEELLAPKLAVKYHRHTVRHTVF